MTHPDRINIIRIAALALSLSLAGCGGGDGAPSDGAGNAVSPEREKAAEQAAAAFDAAVATENWPLAKAQGDVLLADYPDTAAARRIEAQHKEVSAKAEGAREQAHLAALWTYNNEPVKGGGAQLSASIYAKDNIDTDGSGPKQVRLIFRDHPDWGRSSYLVLQAGDFDCYGGCRVPVTVDDQPPKSLPASRPETDEAIAMFIDDEKSLWNMTKDAKTISIEFPVKGQGKKTAVFEVGGLDRGKLPGWD